MCCWHTFRRSGRRRTPVEGKPPPGKDELDMVGGRSSDYLYEDPSTNVRQEIPGDPSMYENINQAGQVNDSTDPAVAPDGYLTKTTHRKVARQSSVPIEQAPAPPSNNTSGDYVIGKAPEKKYSDDSYINIPKAEKGKEVFGVAYKEKAHTKKDKECGNFTESTNSNTYYNTGQPDSDFYENVNNGEARYYNTKRNESQTHLVEEVVYADQ